MKEQNAEAMEFLQNLENQPEPNQETPEVPAAEPAPTPPTLLEIDGETVDLDTLKEWKAGALRQADYTRKTTEIAEQRRQLEAAINDPIGTIMRALETLPPEQKAEGLRQLAQSTGVDLTPVKEQLPPNWEYMTENEQFLYQQNQRAEQAARAEIAELKNILKQVTETVTTQQKQSILMDQAEAAALKFQADGLTVNREAILKAVKESKIEDPERAFWAVHGPEIARGAFRKGVQTVKEKPDTPTTAGKTFDPRDKSLTADDFERLLRAGYTPLKK